VSMCSSRSSPGNVFGAVYFLGVLVVSTRWGLGLAVLTPLASGRDDVAYSADVRNWPAASVLTEPQNWVAIVVSWLLGYWPTPWRVWPDRAPSRQINAPGRRL
jgi:hypothetical protein